MGQIGHNHAPLEERIFDDPSVSIEDVLTAVAARIERTNKPALETITKITDQLAANAPRLPETFSEEDARKALDLLDRLDQHSEVIAETRENVCAAAEKFVDTLKTLCKPLDGGLAALEKALRPRLESRLIADMDAHNGSLAPGEKLMSSLTIRGPSGAKATLVDGEEAVVVDAEKIPRNFCIPDAKKIAAAIKAGEKIPGVEGKRKTSLRISCK